MIPLVKPMLGIEEEKRVQEVLYSGKLAQGEYVTEFENNFAFFLGSNYGVATSSGTTALHVALLASGIKGGDKVITTPFSFIASANAILYVQGVPVFCDIDVETYNISLHALRHTIKKHPDAKAVIVVHLYGHPAPMPEIMEIAHQYNLTVIEDCAQAHGAAILGKKAGTFGHAGVFSFYASKNMTCGEGGMLVTQDAVLAIPDQNLYRQRFIELPGSFRNARKAAEKVLSIPVHPGLLEEEVDYIVRALQKYRDS